MCRKRDRRSRQRNRSPGHGSSARRDASELETRSRSRPPHETEVAPNERCSSPLRHGARSRSRSPARVGRRPPKQHERRSRSRESRPAERSRQRQKRSPRRSPSQRREGDRSPNQRSGSSPYARPWSAPQSGPPRPSESPNRTEGENRTQNRLARVSSDVERRVESFFELGSRMDTATPAHDNQHAPRVDCRSKPRLSHYEKGDPRGVCNEAFVYDEQPRQHVTSYETDPAHRKSGSKQSKQQHQQQQQKQHQQQPEELFQHGGKRSHHAGDKADHAQQRPDAHKLSLTMRIVAGIAVIVATVDAVAGVAFGLYLLIGVTPKETSTLRRTMLQAYIGVHSFVLLTCALMFYGCKKKNAILVNLWVVTQIISALLIVVAASIYVTAELWKVEFSAIEFVSKYLPETLYFSSLFFELLVLKVIALYCFWRVRRRLIGKPTHTGIPKIEISAPEKPSVENCSTQNVNGLNKTKPAVEMVTLSPIKRDPPNVSLERRADGLGHPVRSDPTEDDRDAVSSTVSSAGDDSEHHSVVGVQLADNEFRWCADRRLQPTPRVQACDGVLPVNGLDLDALPSTQSLLKARSAAPVPAKRKKVPTGQNVEATKVVALSSDGEEQEPDSAENGYPCGVAAVARPAGAVPAVGPQDTMRALAGGGHDWRRRRDGHWTTGYPSKTNQVPDPDYH